MAYPKRNSKLNIAFQGADKKLRLKIEHRERRIARTISRNRLCMETRLQIRTIDYRLTI